MANLDLSTSSRIAENASQKFEANQAVNHRDAIVSVYSLPWSEDAKGRIVQITVHLPPEDSKGT